MNNLTLLNTPQNTPSPLRHIWLVRFLGISPRNNERAVKKERKNHLWVQIGESSYNGNQGHSILFSVFKWYPLFNTSKVPVYEADPKNAETRTKCTCMEFRFLLDTI